MDVESIVNQLMEIEREPLSALSQQKDLINAQISAYGRLKSTMSGFQSAMSALADRDKFNKFLPSSSDEAVATATASSNSAARGLYQLEVSRLAQHHKLGSDEVADTATFGGGAGDTLNLTAGDDTMALDLSTAMTLNEIRDAINQADDNPGVAAAVLNTGDGKQRLILTADQSGYDDRIQLSYGGGIAAGTFNLVTNNRNTEGTVLADLAELDAAYTLDGYALTAKSNSISSAISGITFELEGLGKADLSFDRDDGAILESIQAFADAYNSVRSTIDELRRNELEAEATLLSIEAQINGVINTAASFEDGDFSYLAEVGLSIDKQGQMQVDSGRLSSALDTDFNSVVSLFADTDAGFAERLQSVAGSIVGFGGMLDIRTDGLNERISLLDTREERIELRLISTERRIRAQFTALDGLVAQLQSTGSFLTQQLSSLNNSEG